MDLESLEQIDTVIITIRAFNSFEFDLRGCDLEMRFFDIDFLTYEYEKWRRYKMRIILVLEREAAQ